MSSVLNAGASVLAPPQRNNFFYGMLLDVAACQKDQRYADLKRALLNRFVFGPGVVSGLALTADASAPGRLWLEPGLAIDGWGREIVVSERVSFDPRQLTDDDGTPAGEPLTAGPVNVFLAYDEEQTDPVPALAPCCDSPEPCALSTVREGCRILVRTPPPPADTTTPASAPVPWTDAAALRTYLSGRVSAAPAVVTDPAIALGQVVVDTGSLDTAAGRPLVLGHAVLWELIASLAAEVAALKANP